MNAAVASADDTGSGSPINLPITAVANNDAIANIQIMINLLCEETTCLFYPAKAAEATFPLVAFSRILTGVQQQHLLEYTLH